MALERCYPGSHNFQSVRGLGRFAPQEDAVVLGRFKAHRYDGRISRGDVHDESDPTRKVQLVLRQVEGVYPLAEVGARSGPWRLPHVAVEEDHIPGAECEVLDGEAGDVEYNFLYGVCEGW